jgi:lipoprotein-anchoring transpeptidase ErfK/SrfK
MGVIGSHGCVRMRNADMVALFDMANVGVEVDIQP